MITERDPHGGATPTEHRDVLLDLFTEISADCERLGLRPSGFHIGSCYGLDVDVHMDHGNLAAVDALADAYGFGPEVDPENANYTRAGRLDIAGHSVSVGVYTGRPTPAEVTA